MNIKVDREALLNGVHVVYGAVNERSSLPILANMLLKATKNTLCMTATNLDIGISYKIDIETADEGSIAIPAKRFFDIVKETTEPELLITSKKNNIVMIECGRSFFRMMGLPKEEFPKIPEIRDGIDFIINQSALKEMLNLTIFAISQDETRYVLNGVLFHIDNNKLSLVATDGRRLAVASSSLSQSSGHKKGIIVPAKTVYELNKILKNEGRVEFMLSDNQALLKMDNIEIASRLIEGEFPNYENVIPNKKEGLRVDREMLLSSLKRVSIFTTQDSAGVRFDISKNRLVISKQSPDIGEAKDELDIGYAGDEMAIGFNPNYIIDVLKNLTDDEIEFELNGPDKPGAIRKEGYTYIVLPMQL